MCRSLQTSGPEKLGREPEGTTHFENTKKHAPNTQRTEENTPKTNAQTQPSRRIASRCALFWVHTALFLYFAYVLLCALCMISTCEDSKPLVVSKRDFLSPTELSAMRHAALNHPFIRGGAMALDQGNFKGTAGFMTSFNSDGAEALFSDPRFKEFADFFNRTRIPGTNAFVFQVLICYPAANISNADPAVGAHYDNSVALYGASPYFMYLSYQTTVLYLNVPDDMVGGKLELWSYTGLPFFEPEQRVTPQTNTLVEFRGDALHRVQPFASAKGGARVSLVMEQYFLNQEDYSRSVFLMLNGVTHTKESFAHSS
eukprot:comp5199_c0_seq1/m.1240 comp5199_c0_seq1/g.1240  ORF comp5199_c0_seq1/g.1240 comp5199_c0_seq1/m.1240 type:complete len:314 (-) comp5199_c0_seq1:355-1296(-)